MNVTQRDETDFVNAVLLYARRELQNPDRRADTFGICECASAVVTCAQLYPSLSSNRAFLNRATLLVARNMGVLPL